MLVQSSSTSTSSSSSSSKPFVLNSSYDRRLNGHVRNTRVRVHRKNITVTHTKHNNSSVLKSFPHYNISAIHHVPLHTPTGFNATHTSQTSQISQSVLLPNLSNNNSSNAQRVLLKRTRHIRSPLRSVLPRARIKRRKQTESLPLRDLKMASPAQHIYSDRYVCIHVRCVCMCVCVCVMCVCLYVCTMYDVYVRIT